MIYYKSNRTGKPGNISTAYYFRNLTPEKKDSHISSVCSFDAVTKFYSAMPSGLSGNSMELGNCFALTLARFICDRISEKPIPVQENSILPDSFYSQTANEALDIFSADFGRELMLIYLKQCVHLLKGCGIISADSNNVIYAEKDLSPEKFYRKLFRSFWEETEWRDIFPSSIETADFLHKNRKKIILTLSGSAGDMSIVDLANEIFSRAGLNGGDDFFLISFIDFYLLTWLKHFGIIEYSGEFNGDAVAVTVTDPGRKLLKSLI